jgi:L-fuculose-phosphate aldolase
MSDQQNLLKDEIINIGKKLYELRLVVARSGNLSSRLDKNTILITATGTSLGSLAADDIVKVDLTSEQDIKNKRLTSEFPLHSAIYKNFTNNVIIHCHPTLTNAYFAVAPTLKTLTFETKLSLGNIPVLEQDTPSITKLEPVIEALKVSNIVVLKNHGVVAIADKFKDALHLIEELEEAVKVAAIARLFDKDILDDLDAVLKEDLTREEAAYPMFSREHVQAIVDLVNKDELIAQKGKEMDLTLQLAIKLNGTDKAFKFNFEKGKIIRLDPDGDAPFVISAPKEIWEQVFLGKLDSFVAVTQGKMKLEGQLAQLSKWYVPFTQLFVLFKQVRFK